MNILVVYNDFSGAYGSLLLFQNELSHSLGRNHCLFFSHSSADTVKICETCPIDFSLGIGSFNQYVDGVPVYDVTGVPHFQWIIDNPLKMEIDVNSRYITYILIDRDFVYSLNGCCNKPLFMPLGFEGKCKQINLKLKTDGIVFCGQIKSCRLILRDIVADNYKKQILSFICDYDKDLDQSLEYRFSETFGKLPLNEQKIIFKIINSYYRAKKRKIVVNSIHDYPIYIIGDVTDDEIRAKNNVNILTKLPYEQVWNEVSRYKYSLNVSPNFHDAIHDRIVRSILYGTMPVSDAGTWCREVFGSLMLSFRFQDLSIEDSILRCDNTDYFDRLCNLQTRISRFRWINLLQEIMRIKEK